MMKAMIDAIRGFLMVMGGLVFLFTIAAATLGKDEDGGKIVGQMILVLICVLFVCALGMWVVEHGVRRAIRRAVEEGLIEPSSTRKSNSPVSPIGRPGKYKVSGFDRETRTPESITFSARDELDAQSQAERHGMNVRDVEKVG